MQHIDALGEIDLSDIRYILTDMDETLTFQGRLAASTYKALEDLQRGGIRVIINTAAPAGWCDQMARMWPVDGVIGENGGLFFRRGASGAVIREFWHEDQTVAARQLKSLGDDMVARHPSLLFAEDQIYRSTSLAFNRVSDRKLQSELLTSFEAAGARATVNNLWLLAWLGDYDKLKMARRVLKNHFALDIDQEPGRVAYVGDSENDGPMFQFFRHSFGVSTVVDALDCLVAPPAWITTGPGGQGFVEVVDCVLQRG